MGDRYVSCTLDEILIGEALPGTVYLYMHFRFVTFRAEGDVIDTVTFDRLDFKKVKNLFILEKDRDKFSAWLGRREAEIAAVPPLPSENQSFKAVREDVKRKLHDIFQGNHPEKMVAESIELSKALVNEVMKFPYAVHSLAQLQSYSRGTVDHSINVSVLSVYLAMQMGYSHNLILQHVGTGALLHDIGKPKVPIEDDDTPEGMEKKMLEHPTMGLRLIESQANVPNEVKMIIAQHHECNDGTGYPKKLRGGQVYDLARIVSIANVFDELTGDATGTLHERQKHAIQQIDQVLYRKFDPQKLDKALKILKLGV